MSPSKHSAKGKRKESFTKKAPGAPKRFKSSYILFFIQSQEEIKKKLPPGSRTAPIVSKRASELWKKISDEERAFWDKEAEKEKRRYIIEKESYTGPWQVPCKRAKKDPTAPRRNPSAFLLYSVAKRTQIKKENPDMKTTEISRILGQLWNDASEDEKRPFIEREEIEREEYKKKMDSWKRKKEIQDQEQSLKSLDSNESDDDWSISESEGIKDQESHANDHGNVPSPKTLSYTPNGVGVAPTMEHTTRYQPPPVVSVQSAPPEYSPSSAPCRLRSESWNTSTVMSPLHPNKRPAYQQHIPPSLAFPHIENVRSVPFMDHHRLSPIPIFRNEQDPPVFYPRPGQHHPSAGMRRPTPYGWPVPQPTYSYHQYKYSNPDPITSMNNISTEPIPTKRDHIFQHNSELGCSPFGSYDELDSPIDPLPIH